VRVERENNGLSSWWQAICGSNPIITMQVAYATLLCDAIIEKDGNDDSDGRGRGISQPLKGGSATKLPRIS